MSKVWLITGSGRGLGLAVVRAALAAGDRVVATARDVGALTDLQAGHRQRLQIFSLDVTAEDAAQQAADFTINTFGQIDVLVNNAGFGRVAPFEFTSDRDFRHQIDVNFYGVVNLVRAVLPIMRSQHGGYIVNISSIGGRVTTPGLSAYQAAKWAVSGFTEVIAKEVANFGIHAISLEPGGMRTDWGSGATAQSMEFPADYDGSVGEAHRRLGLYAGNEVGDPEKIAKVIVDLSRQDNLPSHLILGSDALQAFEAAEEVRNHEMEAWLPVSRSTDF